MGRGKRQATDGGYLPAKAGETSSEQLLAQARELARARHRAAGQSYGDDPYDRHLADVVDVLDRFGYDDSALQAAAWLHDTVEDTATAEEEIRARFGDRVADLVAAVTSAPGKNRRERNAATYPKTRANPQAVVLKLADRIANVENGLKQNSGLVQMYRSEFAGFKEALYVSGEHEEMWAHLDGLLA